MGQCKWFNDQRGYGFITVVEPVDNLIGKDIFVHHTGLVPKNNSFKTLTKGEYVSFTVEWGQKGELQAFQVTGPYYGSLMCDFQLYPYGPMPSSRRFDGGRGGGRVGGRGGGRGGHSNSNSTYFTDSIAAYYPNDPTIGYMATETAEDAAQDVLANEA